MQIIVCGMHRSGTSLTSSIVNKLGIHVGDRLLGKHPSQIHSHWEDVDFYELNMAMLKAAGGNWQRLPTADRLLALKSRFGQRIKNLIARKDKRSKWGFKDPRTCITLPLYLPYLTSPRFILVCRETGRIVDSLIRRGGGSREKWERLTRIYQESMENNVQGYDVLRVQFERLVNRFLARQEIEHINSFIEGNGNIDKALGLVDFRI